MFAAARSTPSPSAVKACGLGMFPLVWSGEGVYTRM